MDKATGDEKKRRRPNRRGKRGSGKGKSSATSIQGGIKELVKKEVQKYEVQKYEEQLPQLLNLHNSSVKQNVMGKTTGDEKTSLRKCGKRGSGKGKSPATSLQGEIKELVKKEVQKYEEKLQQLSNLHNSSVKRNDKIVKMKRTLVENNSMKQQVDDVDKKLNDSGKVLNKQSQKPKKDAKSHYFKSILRNMSQIELTKCKPKNDSENLQNFGFPKSIKRDKMREILAKQNKSNKEYVMGTLRINNKQSQYAYVTCEDDNEDILIQSHSDRNRAMEKDVVAIKINSMDKWVEKANGKFQITGFVVSILEKVHSRTAVGVLMHYKETLKFQPRDPRFPILTIDPETLPEEYKEKNNLKKILFNAKIINWSAPSYCTGKILGVIGDVGDLQAETEAILLENSLDVTPYDDKLLQHLPASDYQFTEDDLLGREDWRSRCVFTIDPATAVDLDDAVSCDKLPNGNFEVGVHIADVTHFLEASTPLDKKISKRATTIYLANTVHHMLPKALTQLCSLLPGKDRLAFSVIWEMTPTGEIKSHRFARTIMNSCFQMSYQQAQKIIENPDLDWSEVDLSIENGYTSSAISEVVKSLFNLSRALRSKRFEGGALKIDQPKLRMIVDQTTKLPVSFYLEERLGSNELIEEFMLLANTTVANHLYKRFPKTALLRHHNSPKSQSLEKAFDSLKNFGVHLNTESAGALQASIAKYEETVDGASDFIEEKFVAHCRMMVINSLCAQAMVRANYICSGNVKKKAQLKHYALNIPLYTHFTSPIRRYADCIVHRLLSSSLENTPMHDDWSRELCTNLAKNCNRMKESARNAQEKSNEIYFAHLLAQKGPTENLAIVMNARHHSLDVILCHVGLTVRIELSELQEHATVESSSNDSVETIKIHWKQSDVCQIINVFTILNVRIKKHPKSYKIHTTLIPPKISH